MSQVRFLSPLPVTLHSLLKRVEGFFYLPGDQVRFWCEQAAWCEVRRGDRIRDEIPDLRASALVGIVQPLHNLEEEPLAAFRLVEDLLQGIAGG